MSQLLVPGLEKQQLDACFYTGICHTYVVQM